MLNWATAFSSNTLFGAAACSQYFFHVVESSVGRASSPPGSNSLNPSTVSSSANISGSWYNFPYPTGSVYDYVTSSYFSPYITTIGLYDEYQNLLAVGKLAQPLQTSNTTDTTILINLDR